MLWFGIYVAVAAVVALAMFVVAEFLREPGVPAPHRPGMCALALGLVWPMLAVAAAQLALIGLLGHRLSHSAGPTGGPRRLPQPVGR